jgi:signal transduction histidine kinase
MRDTGKTREQLQAEVVELQKRVADLEAALERVRQEGARREGAGRARPEESTHRQAAQLEALREVGQTITADSNLNGLLESIVRRAIELVGASAGGLALRQPNRDTLEWTVSVGPDRAPTGSVDLEESGPLSHVWRSGEPLLLDDYRDGQDQAAEELPPTPIAAVPVRWAGRSLGVLCARAESGTTFSPSDTDLLSLFATQAAIAIETARLGRVDREQRELAQAIEEAAAVVGSTLDLDEVLDRILEQVERVIAGDAFNIMLIQKGTACVVRWRGYDRLGTVDQIANLSLPVEEYATFSRMVRTGRSVVVPDTRAYPEWVPLVGWEWLRSYVSAPIRISGLVVGFLNVDGTHRNQFDAADARRLEAFATHAAIAIENAQLYREMAHRLAETTILRETMLAAASTLESDRVIERTFRMLQEAMGVESVALALPTEDGGGLKYHPRYVGHPVRDPEEVLPFDRSVCGQAFRRGEAVLVEDVWELPFRPVATTSMRSQMAIPVRIGDRPIGVMDVRRSRPNAFDRDDLTFYTAIAGQLAVALENARLYEEVRLQARQLATTVTRLQELDRLKSEFIQNVSHELRTPLALIRGYAEMLDEGELGELAPSQQTPVEVIARRTRMLSELVEDITLILGAESRSLARGQVAIDELARASVEDFAVAAEQAGLTLEADIAPDIPPVTGTPIYLRRAMDNLLSNAIKFTPPGGRVSVRLHQEGQEVILEVSDSGIGIPPQEQQRIFDRFYQVDGSARRRYSGIGLGLALVKEIIELHAGRIEVESQLGKGSTFTITLPAGEPPRTG